MKHYDAIVIGAGQAGPGMAIGLAEHGKKVALIEGNLLGGSCVNYGCTPTKTLRKSARVLHIAQRANDFGIEVGKISVDFEAVMARVNRIVTNSRNGLRSWVKGYPDNLDLIEDWASFDGKDGHNFVVNVSEQKLTATHVYLNTGTRASVPPIEGLSDSPYLDNISLLKLKAVPEHLIILGGSYIGIEMGQIFRRLGSKVSIIENSAHLASREDKDVSEAIEELLNEEGIDTYLAHKAQKVTHDSKGIHLHLTGDNGDVMVAGSHLLVAVGRVPNTDTLNAESVGLKLDERGYIPTNGKFETNVKGIWALGDINKRGAFTHTSYQDYEIALANLAGEKRSADGRIMAYAMYSDPPMGRVGMTEKEARESGKNVLMAKYRMTDVSRAKEESETTGLIKLLVDADTEEFLGACVFGIGGDEIVQIFSNYMAAKGKYSTMMNALPVHPTVAEFIPTILAKLKLLE